VPPVSHSSSHVCRPERGLPTECTGKQQAGQPGGRQSWLRALRAAGCGLRAAGCGLRAAGCGLRAAGCGLRAAGCGLRAAGCGRCGLRAAGCGCSLVCLSVRQPPPSLCPRSAEHPAEPAAPGGGAGAGRVQGRCSLAPAEGQHHRPGGSRPRAYGRPGRAAWWQHQQAATQPSTRPADGCCLRCPPRLTPWAAPLMPAPTAAGCSCRSPA
jgi:hypothetical protein